jgi:hypothetical protein
MPSIADTAVEMIQWVFPEHAGAPGQIHGGRMMQWITEAGSMAAVWVAQGAVVLGSLDDPVTDLRRRARPRTGAAGGGEVPRLRCVPADGAG